MNVKISNLGLLATLAMMLLTGYAAGYTYYNRTGTDPDIAWLPLGNGNGHLLATELPANLPVINSMRVPASGKTVINNQTQLSYNYVAGSVQTAGNTRTGYSPTAYSMIEGIQPVVSFLKSGSRITIWPMQMTPVSRLWVQESNILRTVTGTTDFELTTDDFVCSSRNVLVRTFTVKNLTSAAQSFRLLHYVPINPSGRDNNSGESNWKNMASTNYATYDSADDCLIFRGNPSDRWLVGADQRSSGHQCGAAGTVLAAITADGSLSGSDSIGPGVVEAAQSFDSPQIASGDSFSVTVYVGYTLPSLAIATALQQFSSVKSIPGTAFRDTTLAFWQNWLAGGNSGRIVNTQIRTLVRRELMILKACCWDNGGISAVPAELSTFYTRDGMGPARALALFGHWNDAKRIILAKEAYMITETQMNAQNYDSTISARISSGFTNATVFNNITSFSMDDPPNLLFAIGELWNIGGKTDTAVIRQTWPFVEWLVGRGVPDMGMMGTIAQNSGFQDDDMVWDFSRPVAGIECSFWNMDWVSGLEMASGIAATLGYQAQATTYDSLATLIRGNIESKFWSASQNDYAYIHIPNLTSTFNSWDVFTSVADGQGGRWIFPNPIMAEGEGFPFFDHYATDAHAQQALKNDKNYLEPLPANDIVVSNWGGNGTEKYTELLYDESVTNDAALETTKNWWLRNTPLAGAPEVMPVADRAVQTWMTGEELCGLHKYLEITNGFAGVVQGSPSPAKVCRTESSLTSFRKNNRLIFRFDAVSAPASIALYDLAGNTLASIKLNGHQKEGLVSGPAMAAGMLVAVLRDGLNRPIARTVTAAY